MGGTGAARILVADDEQELRRVTCELMESEGFEALEARDGREALSLLRESAPGGPDLALLDIKMPGLSGIDVLREARRFNSRTAVILMTGFGTIDAAVEGVKSGAYDYLTKPVEQDRLLRAVREALTVGAPGPRSGTRRAAAPARDFLAEILGSSDTTGRLLSDIQRVAPTDFTVIITGETGSGKELVARALHQLSLRATGPFLALDCGSIAPTLFENELFGHEVGAFTGAERARPSVFEMASGGTLFLDELPSLSLALQPKLLRALQERQVWRLGATKPVDVDVRVVAATNEDLPALVDAGRFRRDLFYRLNEFTLTVPPLRERRQDIVILAQRFLESTNQELEKGVRGISEAAQQVLLAHRWPGNVRELRNVIRRAVLFAETCIGPDHLDVRPADLRGPLPAMDPGPPLDGSASLKEIVARSIRQVEREILVQALTKSGGNKAEAARALRIDYKTFLKKARAYRIAL